MPEKLPLTEKLRRRYKHLEDYYKGTGIKLSYPGFIGIILIIAVAVAYVLFQVLMLSVLIAVIAFFALCTLIIGVPMTMRDNRIASIESDLPDVLKHMAAVLRAGGTTENALEEASKSDYGPLSEDLGSALKQLREGRNFDEVLADTARLSGSTLFVRVAAIVIDAKKAGAGLADVMNSIAEDARDLLRIKRERVSRTTMHVLFLYAASLLLGPFIFGFALSIVGYIGLSTAGALAQGAPEQAASVANVAPNLAALNNTLIAFIGAQVILTILVIGAIREGKVLKYILRLPFLVLFALLAFEGGKWFSTLIIGGPTL